VTGNLDLARMGTVYYLQTKQQYPEIEALVEMESSQKAAVFFTRTHAGIRTLGDLRGKRVAFGDATSSVTFWGQAKLADEGMTGSDLAEYTFLNSRSEFIEEAHELGVAAALKRKRWLHSTADVIEGVVSGRFDAGVTTENGYSKHQHRGLVRIPGSEFLRRPSPWVARGNLPADLARDLVAVFTEIRNIEFLLLLPDRPSGFSPITEATHAQEREAMDRIERLFPISSPPLNEPFKPTPKKVPTQ